jgi:hypothetical protein
MILSNRVDYAPISMNWPGWSNPCQKDTGLLPVEPGAVLFTKISWKRVWINYSSQQPTLLLFPSRKYPG